MTTLACSRVTPALFAALAAVAACSGNPAGITPGGATAARYTAGYAVPGAGPAGTYDVAEVRWIVAGDAVVLAYDLPALLVGARVRVAFAGTLAADGASATLAGAAGTARCTVDPARRSPVRCDERFAALAVDLAGVAAQAARVDPAAVDARVAAATQFSTEPIGVLEVRGALADGVACGADGDCAAGALCEVEAGTVGTCSQAEPACGAAACAAGLECETDPASGAATCVASGRGR